MTKTPAPRRSCPGAQEIAVAAFIGLQHVLTKKLGKSATWRGRGPARASPAEWGKRAVAAYKRWQADRIVAEQNYVGAMVEHVIRTVDKNVPVELVTSTRG